MTSSKPVWDDFKSKMANEGVCTNGAMRQVLIEDYVKGEMKRKEDATFMEACKVPQSTEKEKIWMFSNLHNKKSLASAVKIIEKLNASTKSSTIDSRASSLDDNSLSESNSGTQSLLSSLQSSPSQAHHSVNSAQSAEDQRRQADLAERREHFFDMMISGYVGSDYQRVPRRHVAKRRSTMELTSSFLSDKAVTFMDAFNSSMPDLANRTTRHPSLDNSAPTTNRIRRLSMEFNASTLTKTASRRNVSFDDTQYVKLGNSQERAGKTDGVLHDSFSIPKLQPCNEILVPVEVHIDDKVKALVNNTDDILVDFPRKQRRPSMNSTTYHLM